MTADALGLRWIATGLFVEEKRRGSWEAIHARTEPREGRSLERGGHRGGADPAANVRGRAVPGAVHAAEGLQFRRVGARARLADREVRCLYCPCREVPPACGIQLQVENATGSSYGAVEEGTLGRWTGAIQHHHRRLARSPPDAGLHPKLRERSTGCAGQLEEDEGRYQPSHPATEEDARPAAGQGHSRGGVTARPSPAER